MKKIFKKLGKVLLEIGLQVLMDKVVRKTAEEVVKEIAVNLSNSSDIKKFDRAKAMLKARLEIEGKKVKDRILNLAIEYAVNKIKEEL